MKDTYKIKVGKNINSIERDVYSTPEKAVKAYCQNLIEDKLFNKDTLYYLNLVRIDDQHTAESKLYFEITGDNDNRWDNDYGYTDVSLSLLDNYAIADLLREQKRVINADIGIFTDSSKKALEAYLRPIRIR